MSGRRGHGEGSIHKRSDGRWAATIDLGRENGKRKRKTVYAATREKVATKLRERQSQLAQGLPLPDERRTTGEYLTWWAKEVLPGTVKESTAYGYRSVLDRNVVPHVGHVRLAKLSPAHVQAMMRALESAGLAPQTRRNARMVLRRALGYAVRWGLLVRNTAALVDCPRGTPPNLADALSAEEAQRLLVVAREDRLGAIVTVALTMGLRRGEILGLRWRNIDFDARTLTVDATLKRVVGAGKGRAGTGLVLDQPKTDRAVRTVAIPVCCIEALREHRRRQLAERLAAGSNWHDDGFVFTTSLGRPIDPDNLARTWHRLCDASGTGRRRFHALRHTAATLMLAEGTALEVISRTLGHASYAITADVYAHVGQDVQRRAAEAMDRALIQ
jgi:integrase